MLERKTLISKGCIGNIIKLTLASQSGFDIRPLNCGYMFISYQQHGQRHTKSEAKKTKLNKNIRV